MGQCTVSQRAGTQQIPRAESTTTAIGASRWRHILLDVLLIAVASFLLETTHFSFQQGRSVICGDSAQYVNSAEALIEGNKAPHFEMRKPGYTLLLAGIGLAFGNMGWAAVVCNHFLLALLPLAGYGTGRHLHGRAVGIAAALIVMVQLQGVVYGNRVLSESLFVCLLSFGLLVLAVGSVRPRPAVWNAAAGTLLGLAWLTRGTGTAVIAAAAVFLVIVCWRHRRKTLISVGAFALPIVVLVCFECELNRLTTGQFRPANGTAGATLALRLRHLDGADVPQTEAAQQVVALLPERSEDDVFLANHVDVWVARYRAIHDQGMDEWEYDGLMGRFGRDMVATRPLSYIWNSVKMAGRHLLRVADGEALSSVADERRAGILIHPAAPDAEEGDVYWYAYWGLPHLSLEDSVALVDRMKIAAAQEAPFGDSRFWAALRYYISMPAMASMLSGLRHVGSLWPGFALLGCAWLGLNRRTCLLFGLAYLADAALIGLLTPTTHRMQFIWIVTDAALTAGVLVVVPVLIYRRVRSSTVGHTPVLTTT
ncbi:MAG: glycosyltransferase family 39 protein [Planctomycetes bacterium]|nr:glycosyltransferase family 39 protein [Planctomycetota bacterium]